MESYTTGSLLSAPVNETRGKKTNLHGLTPDEHSSLARYSTTKDHLLLTILRDVKTEIEVWTPVKKHGSRRTRGSPVWDNPVTPVDGYNDNQWLTVRDYITPNTLFIGDVSEEAQPTELKKLPEFFDAKLTGHNILQPVRMAQRFPTSKSHVPTLN